jgi:hypothetical protein
MEHAFRWETTLHAMTSLPNPNCMGFSKILGDIGPFFIFRDDDGTSDLSRPRSPIKVSFNTIKARINKYFKQRRLTLSRKKIVYSIFS